MNGHNYRLVGQEQFNSRRWLSPGVTLDGHFGAYAHVVHKALATSYFGTILDQMISSTINRALKRGYLHWTVNLAGLEMSRPTSLRAVHWYTPSSSSLTWSSCSVEMEPFSGKCSNVCRCLDNCMVWPLRCQLTNSWLSLLGAVPQRKVTFWPDNTI